MGNVAEIVPEVVSAKDPPVRNGGSSREGKKNFTVHRSLPLRFIFMIEDCMCGRVYNDTTAILVL